MSVRDTFAANYSKTAYTSLWDMDKIIGTGSGSFTVAAPTAINSPTSATSTYSTNFGDFYYFQAIYSVDNGASWNDFNAMVPDLSTPGSPVLDTVVALGAVGSSGTFNIFAFNYYDLVHGTGTAKTIMWKALFFSRNTQGAITPQIINDQTYFTSVERNYQKVAFKDSVTFNLTSGSGQTASLSHNLGYVPMVRAYYIQTTPSNRLDSLWGGYRIEIRVTETTLSFVLDSAFSNITCNGRIEYKIYYDN